MESISIYVGKKIKFYRKQMHLSIAQFSELISKSKSTVSKYENGQISIDLQTLYEIAQTLNVEIHQLIDFQVEKKSLSTNLNSPFNGQRHMHIYFYDGRKRRIVKSYLTINPSTNSNDFCCSFYMDIPSFENFEKCSFYYLGSVESYDLVTYVHLVNQANPMEKMSFCILNSLYYQSSTWGLMFGISYRPIAPFSLKFLMSSNPLENEEITADRLTLTTDEIKTIKSLNMFILDSI
ncbi:helix-turn-helix domain-containing protein [Acetobacterium woodii]|uniref:Transcriptional regulator XRE family n=1 Tax=Acetobacterium woodii (strain ATCC 29683 / DSM 1030 / JCM 2381 / KCTC 1655 / WB1) TaxID=931626 RepID=H6LIG6_ACEWD|nr:helix-turn-helix transcriptional regulator [Acetobacterium woodii]AFA47340.1 transcriptional regulator XRE family [Acetobacterium woodii DSM 1030]